MNDQVISHEEVDSLLPWYVNETLDEEKRQRVSDHLDHCRECRDSLHVLHCMRDAVNDQRATVMIPEPRMDDLLQQVDLAERPTSAMTLTQPWLKAASAAVVTLAAILLLADRFSGQTEAEFRTVTSSDQAAQVGYIMNLTFAPGSTSGSRADLLSELGAQIIAETDAGATQIIIPMEAVSLKDLERFTNELISNPDVATVNIVALQLPIQQDDR